MIIQRTKTGWKEAKIARGSSEQTCPVHALEQWLHFAKIAHGLIFRRVTRDNGAFRLTGCRTSMLPSLSNGACWKLAFGPICPMLNA